MSSLATNINTATQITYEPEINIYCSNLVIEVTRRCNFQCDHCLRGDVQDLDISFNMLREIAKNILCGTVTFTGGEPALNLAAIRKYIEYAKMYSHMPSSFYIVTNGSVNQKELAFLCLEMYADMEEKEMCGLSQSIDDFHAEWLDKKAQVESRIFRGLSFYSTEKEHEIGRDNHLWVLSSGRAKETGVANNTMHRTKEKGNDPLYVESYQNTDESSIDYNIDMIYVSANGNITANCDLPYDEIDKNHLTDIYHFKSYLKTHYPYKMEDNDEFDEYQPVED